MNVYLNEIILQAGELLKDGFYAKKDITNKGKVDLVTQYDKKVEEFLISALTPLYPDFELVGEESFKGDSYPKNAIFIDPIDGTTNFVHQIPHVAISVGFFKEGKPYEAVVYNPITNDLFYAKKSMGSFLNGEKLKVTNTSKLINSLIATGFPYTKVDKGHDFKWVIKNLENILPNVRDIRRFGTASLDLCYIAMGKFDGYYEINLKPWDTSAGMLILTEAGGKVTNEKNEQYQFGDCIVASNTYIHDEFIGYLEKYN